MLSPRQNGEGEFAVLIDGLGNYSRPISTKSELSQKFFDQGLRLVYGYYSPKATTSFKEALRHDPDNPMFRAQGKSTAARKVEQDFERAWKNADVTLKASVF